jgi:hypothetical protein
MPSQTKGTVRIVRGSWTTNNDSIGSVDALKFSCMSPAPPSALATRSSSREYMNMKIGERISITAITASMMPTVMKPMLPLNIDVNRSIGMYINPTST